MFVVCSLYVEVCSVQCEVKKKRKAKLNVNTAECIIKCLECMVKYNVCSVQWLFYWSMQRAVNIELKHAVCRAKFQGEDGNLENIPDKVVS